MLLKGSCHCQAIQYSVEPDFPGPVKSCYCKTCLKTAGGPSVTLVAKAHTLIIQGKENLKTYQAPNPDPLSDNVLSQLVRFFCKICGSQLWTVHNNWPETLYPFASSIDSDLLKTPELMHFMHAFKAIWLPLTQLPNGHVNDYFPEESFNVWKERIIKKYGYYI